VPLSDPSALPCLSEDGNNINVVIETPKGSRNKFAFDEKQKIFRLKKVLPVGMAFPYDFGFVPSTRADDGDPVDTAHEFRCEPEKLLLVGRAIQGHRPGREVSL
jgi:inorganic pyrophosphatase